MILFPLLPGAIHYKNLAPKRIERNWSDLPRYLERPVGRGDDLAYSSSQCPGWERSNTYTALPNLYYTFVTH